MRRVRGSTGPAPTGTPASGPKRRQALAGTSAPAAKRRQALNAPKAKGFGTYKPPRR